MTRRVTSRVLRNIDRVDVHSNVEESLEKQLGIAGNAADAFGAVLEQLTEVKRRVIEQEATKIFRNLTNKSEEYDRIIVDENYDVAVVNKDGYPY